MAIELYHWQIRRSYIRLPVVKRFKRTIPNFGDEIGPMIVKALLAERGLPPAEQTSTNGRLLSVGSVLHFVRPGDHVWGTGLNAKRPSQIIPPREFTVHAVRGPRTAAVLERHGCDVPQVFGDPGLLITRIPAIGKLLGTEKKRKLALIPNFNDLATYRGHPDLVSPLQDPVSVARVIAESELVIGSSLHAMVFADALATPARLMTSSNEHPFKYEDYFLGTGREPQQAAASVDEALRLGAGDPLEFDDAPLLDAFPEQLFVR